MKPFHPVLPALLLLAALAAAQFEVIATRFKQLNTNGDGKLHAR